MNQLKYVAESYETVNVWKYNASSHWGGVPPNVPGYTLSRPIVVLQGVVVDVELVPWVDSMLRFSELLVLSHHFVSHCMIFSLILT